MRTIAIKVKSYAEHANILQAEDNGMILRTLLFAFGTLVLFYMFLLGSMVFNIIERRTLEAEARTLGNEVADLELKYLEASNNVDLALSRSLGFKEAQGVFTTRKAFGSIKLPEL